VIAGGGTAEKLQTISTSSISNANNQIMIVSNNGAITTKTTRSAI
jgi:hypothetical protein